MKRLLASALPLILFLYGAAQPQRPSICAAEMDAMRLQVDAWIEAQASLDAAVPRLDSAIQVVLKADTLAWGRPEWSALIRLYMLQGYYLEAIDDYLQARRAYESGIAIVERKGMYDPRFVYFLYRPLGNVFSRLEETTQAALLLERSVSLLEDSLDFERAARSSVDLGISLQSRGLLKKGVVVLSHALSYPGNSLDTRARLHQIMSGILLDSFQLAPNSAILDLAGSHADSSYRLFRQMYGMELDFEDLVSNVVWLMGKAASLRGDWKTSARHFERAVRSRRSQEEGPNRGLAKVLVQYAEMRMREGNPLAALSLYQQMLQALVPGCAADSWRSNPHHTELYPEYALIDALAGKAMAMLQLGGAMADAPAWLGRAWEACQMAYLVEDSMRALYTYEQSILSLAAASHQRMELGLEVLARLRVLGDTVATDAAIYQLFERNQGQIMGAYLKSLAMGGLVPPIMREREDRARIEIREYGQLMDAEMDPARLRQWREKLLSAGQVLQAVKDSMRLRSPGFHDFRYHPTVIPLGQIQAEVLQGGDGLMQFFWGERAVYRLLILKDRVYFDRLGSTAEIELHLAFLADPAAANEGGALAGHLHALYRLLWMDRVQEIPFRVAIVPDGPLWQLPFEALLTQAESKLGYQSHYLIHHHSIFYAFSASIQWWLVQADHYPALTSGYLGLMPSLEALPALALHAEARPMQETFVARYGGQSHSGKTASRRNLMEAPGCAAILHINSHAFWNTRRPYDSYIALEDSSGRGGMDSLNLVDILTMPPKGRLVILEACTTGVGSISHGEGMESLAKGFVLSGAAGVISTNQAVDAANSSKLIDRFFAGIAEGETIDATLRKAKLSYLKDENLQGDAVMPWVWGAFRPYGSMAPLNLKPFRRQSNAWWIGGGVAVLALFGAWAKLRRKKRSAS